MNPPPLSSPPAKPSSRGCLLYSGIVIVTFLLVFFSACVVTYVMPKKYESTAVIQVKPYIRVGTAFGNADAFTPQFFATELEVIRSQATWKLVVQRLGLTTRWSMTEEDAIAILRGIVGVQNIRGTDLFEIKVKHTNPEDARDIAMEIYQSNQKRREEKAREIREEGIKELELAVAQQSELIKAKQENLRGKLMDAGHNAEDVSKRIEQEFARNLEMLDQSRQKLAEWRIDMNGSSSSLIELHEEPLVAQFPSSPNVTLNLLLGAAAGLFLGLLLALIVRLFTGRRFF